MGVLTYGSYREKWIPNPTASSRTQLDMLKFAGKLLGVAIFKNNMLGLDLPSIVWKYLIGDKPDRNDLEMIDRFSVQSLKEMLSESITADMFDSVFPGLNFTTQLSNNEVVELVPRGKDMPVTYASMPVSHAVHHGLPPLPSLCAHLRPI